MTLTTHVTLPFFKQQITIYLFIFMAWVWSIKLIVSTNIFCISGSVACTVKLDKKKNFMGNYGLLDRFMW